MKKIIGYKLIFIEIYIFLFIYSPPLLKHNISHILTIIAMIYLFFYYKIARKIVKKSKILSYVLPMIFLFLYTLIPMLINEQKIDIYRFYMLIVEIPICDIFIITYLYKLRFTFVKFINIMIIVGVAQAIIAILMLFVPNFKEVINSWTANFWTDRYIGWSRSRMYGFSNNLLHTTPIIQAILGLIALYYTLTISIKYLICVPLLFTSAAINSRTSIVVIIIGLFVIGLFLLNKSRKYMKYIFFIILFISLVPIALKFIETNSPKTYEYIINGFNEIAEFITKGDNDYGFFYTMSNKFIVFPDGFELIFGVGTEIFGGNNIYGVSSDIGFINDIWIGGIFFCIFIVIVVLNYLLRLYKINNDFCKLLSLLLIIVFFIGNFKGILINYNDFMVFSILIVMSGLCLQTNNVGEISYV